MSPILGTNNGLFGLKHLLCIGVSVILIAALFFLLRKKNFRTVCAVFFYCGIVSEIIKIFYYSYANEKTFGGVLPKTDLPFHLCSIQIIFICVLYLTKNEKMHRFLLSFMRPSCLFGGIAAILIATASSRNGGWLISLQYFGYHAILVVFSLYLYTSKEIKFSIKDYFNCLKFLLVIMFFAFYINSMLYDGNPNINFMYVISPPQSGLPFLTEDYGWFVYIVHYAFLVITCVTLSYIMPIIEAVKAKLAKKAEAPADALESVCEETPVEEN